MKNRWLQVLDTCNYWGQAGSRPLDLFLYAPQIQILQAFLDRVGHATNPVISRVYAIFGVDKRVGHAANPVISRVYEGRT